MRLPSKRWQRAVLLFLAAALAVEIGLRIAGHVLLDVRYAHTKLREFHEGDFNILCLGESTTAGLWVKPEESYPKQLEALLRKDLGIEAIRTIVPPHIGQNTSQQANRIDDYLERYKPKLVILMSGANNEWALNESHIADFLDADWITSASLRAQIALDGSRLFRVFRFAYLKATTALEPRHASEQTNAILGFPSRTMWPPPAEIRKLAIENPGAFIALWESDLMTMIDAAKSHSIPVILMSYPKSPRSLDSEKFRALAEKAGVVFVDNGEAFWKLASEPDFDSYFVDGGWHPTARGYSVVAENVRRAVAGNSMLGRK